MGPKVLSQNLQELSEEQIQIVQSKLLEGIPLAYATHSRFFYQAEFYVNEHVLIPRVESELIIEILKGKWKNHYRTIVDIGAGSGCLGLTCAMKFQELSRVILTDISTKSLKVAAFNRKKLSYHLPPHCQIELQCRSCLEEVPRADVIIANPPYIKFSNANQVHPQVYRYEPHEALFLKDADYGNWYQMFFVHINDSIREDGLFIMEGDPAHLPSLKELLRKFSRVYELEIERDLAGKQRFLWAQF